MSPDKLSGSVLFSVGLMGVVVHKLKLFTGSICSIKFKNFDREVLNQGLILFGNVIGASIAAWLFFYTGIETDVMTIAINKLSANWEVVLSKAIFCNILICLAVDEWQKQKNTKGANKDKPDRPDVAFRFPPSNTTNAAFIQNAMALEAKGGLTQYFNLPEVEMADRLCGGHKQVSVLLRNVYDRDRAGALRATADGVTGNPTIRACFTISSNPESTRKFYKYELTNGTFGRMVFSYKARGNRSGKIPRQGKYDDEFYRKLDEYLVRLELCKGRYIIKPLNKLIDKLAQDMATLADLADDDLLFEMSHRSLVSGWKAGCVLWALNNQTWTKAMGELVEWLVYHDIWSKMAVFADLLKEGDISISDVVKTGPKNMLDDLTDSFNEAQLEALRERVGKSKEGTKRQLRVWVHRGFIEYSNQTGLYTKTEKYLKSS